MREGGTLFVSDLDGTLLDRQAMIPAESVRILNELIGEGMLFSIATARASHTALLAIGDLQVRLPMVMINGAYLYDAAGRRIIRSNHMPRESAETVVEFALANGAYPMIYTLKEDDEQRVYYLPPQNAGHESFVSKRLYVGDTRYRLIHGKRDMEKALDQRVINIVCIDTRERLDCMSSYLRAVS